ncbi:MAG: NUDIX domain-containing protein [Lentisphaerae bacterium]|jgi:8-oxo-dGTP diphosphatase|nr:NUDIX domain-containing protein [Lentisphaerota bacterium]MBT5607096.1 NUDIX domain-containing protein [Lentisphaerota bacterium]MBT7844112.1 NUDIX domain-containing protein [Lentisphaerota bacterium]
MNPRATAIVTEGDKILLVHRIKGDRGYWVLPGGSIELGESAEQACYRDVKEETGLGIRIQKQLPAFMNQGRKAVYFLAEPTGGVLELGEPERSRQSQMNQYILEWVGIADLDGIDLRPEQLKTVIAESACRGLPQ